MAFTHTMSMPARVREGPHGDHVALKERVARPAPRAGGDRRSGAAAILALQRTAGNGAVQRWLGGHLVQRACACGGTCERCQADSATAPANFLARKGGGNPLPGSVREFMETRFARDFSGVRIHADTHAAESADAISALAYTAGRDIFFGAGQYRPDSHDGRRLLAHELTHVVQQSGQPVSAQADLRISEPDDHWEREADRAAAAVMDGHAAPAAVTITPLSASVLQTKDCVTGNFTSFRGEDPHEGVLEIKPRWYKSGKVGEQFALTARFKCVGNETSCVNGEYRQFVRSTRKVGGKLLALPGKINGDTFLEDTVEDKVSRRTYRPGHRMDQLNKIEDKATVYSPNVIGCDYWMEDFPHVSEFKAGEKVEIRDEFIGQLIDKCPDGFDAKKETPYLPGDRLLDQMYWRIKGEVTVPSDWTPSPATPAESKTKAESKTTAPASGNTPAASSATTVVKSEAKTDAPGKA